MKERPILFSGPMVRAILDGKKTQTRRVVKPQPRWFDNQGGDFGRKPGEGCWVCSGKRNFYTNGWSPDWPQSLAALSPYGKPGDRLWVRETWGHNDEYPTWDGDKLNGLPKSLKLDDHDLVSFWQKRIAYRATEPDAQYLINGGWKPSIHMPRDHSRLTLEITGVRVERVQDISVEDVFGEGYEESRCGTCRGSGTHPYGYPCRCGDGFAERQTPPRDWYRDLWDCINGKKPGASWAENPFVWVVEFKKVDQ